MNVLLWDIDGTLINTGGAGKRAMTQAFFELTGIDNGLENVRLSGMTDSLIYKMACDQNGVDASDADHEKFKTSYLKNIAIEIEKPNPKKCIFPGIPEILEDLTKVPNTYHGLLTGNYAEGAKIKLSAFGIYGYFSFGAYGDDSPNRNVLYPFAIDRFEKQFGLQPSSDQVWIIGDTPKDVECARPHGARAVAVATGTYSKEQLLDSKPDYLFEDLSNMDAFKEILGL